MGPEQQQISGQEPQTTLYLRLPGHAPKIVTARTQPQNDATTCSEGLPWPSTKAATVMGGFTSPP